jgi:hypothetical protein
MVDGVPAASAVSITEPFSPPEGASEASCVPPTLNYFGASPNPVDYGGSVTLSWSASSPYPLSCNVSSSLGGFSGGSSGSWTVGPVTASTYFELYCWDAYGDGNTWGLTVGVNGGGGGSSSSVPAGWLDTLTSAGVVGGWSCDWDSVATPIYVHVYADGAFVAQVIANVDRPDVAAATWACNGTGNHGFTYQLPNYLLDGAAHTIQVYGINVDGSGGVVGSGNTERLPLDRHVYATATAAAGHYRVQCRFGCPLVGQLDDAELEQQRRHGLRHLQPLGRQLEQPRGQRLGSHPRTLRQRPRHRLRLHADLPECRGLSLRRHFRGGLLRRRAVRRFDESRGRRGSRATFLARHVGVPLEGRGELLDPGRSRRHRHRRASHARPLVRQERAHHEGVAGELDERTERAALALALRGLHLARAVRRDL